MAEDGKASRETMESINHWLALACVFIFGGFLLFALRAARGPSKETRPLKTSAWEARAFEESAEPVRSSVRPEASSLGLAGVLDRESLYAPKEEGRADEADPAPVRGGPSASGSREEEASGDGDLPEPGRESGPAKPKLKANTYFQGASGGAGGASSGAVGEAARPARRASSDETERSSGAETLADEERDAGLRGYRKLKARGGDGGFRSGAGLEGRRALADFRSGGAGASGGRRAARGRFGNVIAGAAGDDPSGAAAGNGRPDGAIERPGGGRGGEGGAPGGGATMYGADGAEYQVGHCPQGTRRVPNEGGATCIKLADAAAEEQPGIFQPTGDPKVPFQNLAGCPGGMAAVVTNQPGPGDKQCVAAKGGQGPRVGDVMGGFGGGDGFGFGSGISFRQK